MGTRRKTTGSDRSSSSSTPENVMGGYTQDDDDDSCDEHRIRRDESLFLKPDTWGCRHVMAFWGFWGFVASYAMRVNLSFAIVSMVLSNNSQPVIINGTSQEVCKNLITSETDGDSVGSEQAPGEFNWSGYEQGIILGSFFWGYVATQVPGGLIAKRIGGKWPFGIGMLITALFSLITPWAARTGVGALITVRVVQGLGEGVTNPSMHALLAKWAPPLERSKIGAFVYAGTQIGTVIALPLSGYLISSNFMGGWPSVFYVFGIAGIVWFVFWCIFVFDTPASHPRIEAKELAYIQHAIGPQSVTIVPTPWRKMLTSMPVLAILVAQTGHGYGLYTLLTELPTYLKTILHFDIKNNGWLSSGMYFSMFVVSIISSLIADYLREKGIASTTTVRVIFNTIAHWGPAIALIGAAYSGCDRTLTVILLTIAVGINGAAWASFQVNHIDIAPNHAAVMMGITNGFANLCGIAAPFIAGVIINDGASLQSWKTIFFIAAVIYVADNIFYILFASGDEQPWNRDESDPHYERITDTDPLLSSRSARRTSLMRQSNSGTYNP